MSLSMGSMYQQIIIDHYKNPQHRGLPEDFDAEVHHVNPTCGDEVTVRVKITDGTISSLGWDGEGCSISQASTSVMSELVSGQPVSHAIELQARFLELMQSQGNAELTEADEDELEDAVAFEGVSKYPARVKCALLGWMAMKSAVAEAGWAGAGQQAGAPDRVEDVVDPSAELNTLTSDAEQK
jgi:nitrogen fixation protein NifU and related proteins